MIFRRDDNFKSCCISCFSAGCLGIVALAIAIYMYAIPNVKNWTLGEKLAEEVERETNTYLTPKDKQTHSRIIIISDTESDYKVVGQVLESLKSENVDAIMHLGDITTLGVPADLEKYKIIFDSLSTPIYEIPGDRDLWKSGGEITAFQEAFGDSYQIVDIKDQKILLIDNANEYEGISDDQWKFIENNLSNVDFVMIHNVLHPNDSVLVGNKLMGMFSSEIDDQRLKLLEMIRNSNVKATFAGDQHAFSATDDEKKAGLMHFVIGSLSEERAVGRPSYAILTIYEDGDYYVEKITL